MNGAPGKSVESPRCGKVGVNGVYEG